MPDDNYPVGKTMSTIERYFDDEGNWRLQVKVGLKFDEVKRGIFLRELAHHGRKTTACIAAGVSITTASYAIKNDPEFNEATAHALLAYQDRLIAHHQDLLFNGIPKYRYDNKGNLIEESRDYPIRLIELELKKHDEGYRDKRDVNMNVSGGVLVAPADTSAADWEKKWSPPVEGEFEEATTEKDDDPVSLIDED